MKLSKLFEELTSLPPELREAFIKGFSILEEVIGEMVTKDEFRELKQVVQELAEKVNELAEAQKRTEEEIRRLGEDVRKLWWGLDDLRKQVGGLSHTVGYTLEDRAINGLPKYLKKRYKIIVKRIDRRYISIDGKKFQINIYIEGKRGDKDIILMGEAKTEPSRKEIEDFLKVIRIIEGKIKGVKPLLVYYSIQDEIKEIAEKEGILLIPSFVLPI